MLTLAVIGAAGLLFVRTVLAVHDTGHFELDGDATSETTDDWDRVCFQQARKEGLSIPDATARCTATSPTTGNGFDADGAGPGTPIVGAIAVAWVAEPERSATIFTGGGSKDPQDINQWAWKNDPDAGDVLHGGLPDKDNLLHAYAARYSLAPTGQSGNCPNGTGDLNNDGDTNDPGEVPFSANVPCDVLYFGLDRLDNSGDAQTGFWFMQNPVALANTKVGGGNGFSGLHKAGDLLVISDFSNGGTVSTITILKWDPTCKGTGKPKTGGVGGFFCADVNLAQLASSDDANCGTAVAHDPFCGLVNNSTSQGGTGTITMPWEFTDKSGTLNNAALAGEFYEAGINLSKLGLAGECFSSIVSETRSSTSPTATLKDFVVGQFANCVPGLTTVASKGFADPVIPGTAVHDTATVKVTGGSSTNTTDPTGTVTFFLCGPTSLALPPVACTTSGANIGTGTLDGGAATKDGEAVATSPNVNCAADGTGCAVGKNPLASGVYCFRAEWPGDALYKTPLSHTDDSLECFAVKDTSAASTAQNWLPNDTATVTLGGGGTPTGSVTFTLYNNGTCDTTNPLDVLATFADRPVDATGKASTNNGSDPTKVVLVISPGTTVSWLATFTPTDATGVQGSTATCEKSIVTITDK